MRLIRSSHAVAVLVTALVVLGGWAAAGAGAAPTACDGFPSQAAAQERFDALRGSPSHDAAGLDADADGVACEGLPGPYEGFATIGYNRKRHFLYGTASMPVEHSGSGFACLTGNGHFAEGPRLLRIHRVMPDGGDRVVSRVLGAEAKPASGRLLWKLEKEAVTPGVYYAAFEEEVRLSPYKPSECPAFSSPETRLPRPL